jgi:hypothetical protein
MNNFRKEYFNDYYYFLIEGDGEDFTLSYSTYSVISEGKKNQKKKFKKKDFKKVEDKIKKVTKSNKKVTKKELDELIDFDGTFLSSKIPFLNQYLTPKKTMDQTVVAARISNDPVTRGYRVYYGESKDVEDDIIYEIDYSDAFGYEETEDAKNYDEAEDILTDMGIDDDENLKDRLETLGFDKKLDKSLKKEKNIGRCKNCFVKRRLNEKQIEEDKRNKMIKMVEDIITNTMGRSDGEVIEKNESLSKILVKNLENIKKLAKKEGISLNKLLNVLKKGE